MSAWVSNRDLPTLLPHGGPAGSAPQWRLESPGPVLRVDALRGPTRPVTRRPVGDLGWSLVSHLTLNHLSLVGESPQRAAAALRTMLGLYAPPEDVGWARQADGVRCGDSPTKDKWFSVRWLTRLQPKSPTDRKSVV